MSIRRTTKPRRVVAAVSMTTVMTLAVMGCGGESGESAKSPASSSSTKSPEGDKGATDDTAAGENVDQNAKLAQLNGRDGLVLVVNEAKRDSGGFVTVSGVIKNEGDGVRSAGQWSGTESIIVPQNPNSVAGATLIDKVGKKRYYILRDTDGRCLCTTGLSAIQPDKSVSVFMQFPAPPSTTTEVDFTLPTFATASLKISG
ncbi:hypothetical protein [Streptomyces clavifer]|uniref:hypothetical protein n=1 Tax=Streptomyces clavifer TaxID=68188 RepID=UPI002E8167CE|nr:hypothetical protein [Streptomyces clavifer]WRY83929.1 hypothetical protein OG388_23165 [Streptomyces clavifer]WUC29692.1 hypothetical protein OG927_21070 [Streptomyces clavifer]